MAIQRRLCLWLWIWCFKDKLWRESTAGLVTVILILKKRERNSYKPYHRRLLDQTHTLQIFLQDRFQKHPNWQSHLRILFGSGFLYNYRSVVKNPNTEKNEFVVNLDNPQEYFLYLRADMGLTAAFKISNASTLTFSVEVLNVFNHY